MKFYQHIYGRVSKGFQSNSPGYQLAALSLEIKDEQELINNLNKYSFFNYRNASENDYRYSFFQPVKGFLAFSVSHYAKDKVGASGSFAHNLVCNYEEFIKSNFSPAGILKAFTFFLKNEGELGDDRILPQIELPETEVAQIDHKWDNSALYIINSILSKAASIPLVVQKEEETWELLTAIYKKLPRLEAMRFTFSTLFIDSLNFADGFRLVFIPEKKYIPSGSGIFDIIPGDMELSIHKPSVYVEFILAYPEKLPDLLRFTDILRYKTSELESSELINSASALFINPKLFRNCVEFLKLQNIFKVILTDISWFSEYYKAGLPFKYEGDIADLVWSNQNKYLETLLKSANQLTAYSLRREVINDLVNRTLTGSGHLEIEILKKTNNLEYFYEKAVELLKIDSILQLANKLKNEPVYSNELHYFIAESTLKALVTEKRSFPASYLITADWLYDEVYARGIANGFIKCVAILNFKLNHSKEFRDFRLAEYRLAGDQYMKIAEVLIKLWSITSLFKRDDVFLKLIFDNERKQNLIRLLMDNLYNFKKTFYLFDELIGSYNLNYDDYSIILGRLRSIRDSNEYASDFRKILAKHRKLDERLSQEFRNLERKGGFLRF